MGIWIYGIFIFSWCWVLLHLIESDTCDDLSTVSPRFIVLIDIDLIVSAHR